MSTKTDAWPEECSSLTQSLLACPAEWLPAEHLFKRRSGHRSLTKARSGKQFMIRAFKSVDGKSLKLVACLGPWAEGWAG